MRPSFHYGAAAAAAAALLALAGCAVPAPTPLDSAALPPDAVQGAGDPARGAIIGSAYAFGTPSSLAGNPAAAARALANLEFLAAEIPTGPRWREFDPTVGLQLRDARAEARAALNIAPAAPSQPVVDALYATARALSAGDQAAATRLLSPPLFLGGGEATLARLAALPPLPRANVATSRAAAELDRVDRLGNRRGGGGSGGRF